MAYSAPSKKQKEVMRRRLANPFVVTQAQVIRELKLADSTHYYRVFERCVIANRKEQIQGEDEA